MGREMGGLVHARRRWVKKRDKTDHEGHGVQDGNVKGYEGLVEDVVESHSGNSSNHFRHCSKATWPLTI